MLKYLVITLVATGALLVACGGSATNSNENGNRNTNANSNANNFVTLDNANLPPGLSAEPITPAANAPGIPANGATQLPKGTTPTPGIPSPEQLKKGVKPGLTPTPGIPSPEEIKRMMANPANIKTAPPGNEVPMMKSMKSTKPKPTP